jgi:hypothetical protein
MGLWFFRWPTGLYSAPTKIDGAVTNMKTCVFCGEPFEAHGRGSSWKKTCSQKCRLEANAADKAQSKLAMIEARSAERRAFVAAVAASLKGGPAIEEIRALALAIREVLRTNAAGAAG